MKGSWSKNMTQLHINGLPGAYGQQMRRTAMVHSNLSWSSTGESREEWEQDIYN